MDSEKNKHIGSNFEDFLKEEGIFDEVDAAARKRTITLLKDKPKEITVESKRKKRSYYVLRNGNSYTITSKNQEDLRLLGTRAFERLVELYESS